VIPPRIPAIDAVRGFALLGILLMNIVGFGLPGPAYEDPRAWGAATAADYAAWALAYVFADGKMRGLFTMLFGASLAILADRAAADGGHPAAGHYRRMAALLAIGLIHAWAIWYGDILVEYALAGAILFPAWRWRPPALLYAAFLLTLASLLRSLDEWWGAIRLRALATEPEAAPAIVAQWRVATGDPAARVAADLAGYRGDLATVAAARWHDALALQADLPLFLIDTAGLVLFGIALLRLDYFTGWSTRAHLRVVAIGYGIGLPAMAGLAALLLAGGFDPVDRRLATASAVPLRPAIALAYASTVILIVRAGIARRLVARLAAAGRMALSNYLATSLVCTTLFYGTGLGLYGRLDRAALYLVVLPVWIAILLWSKAWLGRFAMGPAEWLWRTLATGRSQQMRRIDVATKSQ